MEAEVIFVLIGLVIVFAIVTYWYSVETKRINKEYEEKKREIDKKHELVLKDLELKQLELEKKFPKWKEDIVLKAILHDGHKEEEVIVFVKTVNEEHIELYNITNNFVFFVKTHGIKHIGLIFKQIIHLPIGENNSQNVGLTTSTCLIKFLEVIT